MDVSVITSWLKLTPFVLWSFVVVIGLMLWGPNWFVSGLGLTGFIDIYRNYLGVFWLLSLIGALTPASRMLVKKTKEWFYICLSKKRLKVLTPREKEILARFINEDTRTQTLGLNDGVVSGLRHERIIYPAASIGSPAPGNVLVDHNIQPWAWDFLQKNPHLLQQLG